MTDRGVTVETTIAAPVEEVWRAYTTPEDIMQWNAASDDWHTPSASVDLREGGSFTSRMEARDGSMGFDFAGTYTRIERLRRIEYSFGERMAAVTFEPVADGVRLRIRFDPEMQHSREEQRAGWQAILDRFKHHVESRTTNGQA